MFLLLLEIAGDTLCHVQTFAYQAWYNLARLASKSLLLAFENANNFNCISVLNDFLAFRDRCFYPINNSAKIGRRLKLS